MAQDVINSNFTTVDSLNGYYINGTLQPKAVYLGTQAYVGGGTSTAKTVTGVLATDTVIATMIASTNSVSLNKAVPTTNTITFTFSADPGASTVVAYQVFR